MFANIKKTSHLARTLRYHERKIEQGVAECLAAENFVKDLDRLSQKDKLFHFTRLTSLNERMQKHVFHIALLFYPDEIVSNTKMQLLGKDYMHQMGLGKQPYLMYRHYDSKYPHIHLLTVAVKQHGERIDLAPTDLSYSGKITHKMEIDYNLHKTGHQLKESAVYSKLPKQLQHPHPTSDQQRVITTIEWVLAGKTHDFNTLKEDLAQERISMELRKEGVVYIDHASKTTIEGKTLGQRYTLEGLLERGVQEASRTEEQSLEQKQSQKIRLYE